MHADPVAVNELAWWERDENTRFERASKHLTMDVVWKVISASSPINDYETIEKLVRLPCISISRDFFERLGKKKSSQTFCVARKMSIFNRAPTSRRTLCNLYYWIKVVGFHSAIYILYMEWQDIRSLCITPLLTMCTFKI